MDTYQAVVHHVVQALKKVQDEGYDRDRIYAPLVDVLAGLTLEDGGEDGAREAIKRIEARIVDWKAGRFPTGERQT